MIVWLEVGGVVPLLVHIAYSRILQTWRRGQLQRREREPREPFACTRPSSTPACSWRSVWIRRRRYSRAQVSPQPERQRRKCWHFFGAFSHHSFASGPRPFISHPWIACSTRLHQVPCPLMSRRHVYRCPCCSRSTSECGRAPGRAQPGAPPIPFASLPPDVLVQIA